MPQSITGLRSIRLCPMWLCVSLKTGRHMISTPLTRPAQRLSRGGTTCSICGSGTTVRIRLVYRRHVLRPTGTVGAVASLS